MHREENPHVAINEMKHIETDLRANKPIDLKQTFKLMCRRLQQNQSSVPRILTFYKSSHIIALAPVNLLLVGRL